MGWNYGWTIMQEQVIGLYDLLGESFTKKVCKAIMKPFYETDFDEGGKDYNLFSKDGKSEEQIVVEAMQPDFDPDSVEVEEWNEATPEILKQLAYSQKFYELCRDREVWK